MSFDARKNFAYSIVATAPNPASTGGSLGVQAGTGALFPAPPFNAVVWPANTNPTAANAEVVRVTGVTVDTFTISRHQEGSSAQNVAVGYQIMAGLTDKTLDDIENLLNGTTAGAVLSSPSLLTPSMTSPSVSGGSFSGNPNFSGAPAVSDFSNAGHDHHNAANGGQLNGATALQADSVTPAVTQNRLRQVYFIKTSDNTGGVSSPVQQEANEIQFAGTPSGFGRLDCIVPVDYLTGTDAAIKLYLYSANTNNQALNYYVGSHGVGALSNWNVQLNQTTGATINLTANTVALFTLYTIPAANLAPGQMITIAVKPASAITGNIWIKAAYLEYTADS